MGSASFDTRSVWQSTEKSFYLPLSRNTHVDVCVIGSGIAGLTTAYRLLKEGRTVIVLDRERLGLGETGLTSAHLASALDDGFAHLRRLHGEDGARLAVESHAAAIDLIEQIAREENISCEFERVEGYLFRGPNTDRAFLEEEMKAARDMGLGVELLEKAPVRLFDTGDCLRFPRQAQFHPVRYLVGLAKAIQEMGGRIFNHSEVVHVEGGAPARVRTTQGFELTCEAVVVATNVPINNRVNVVVKVAPYRSYMIAAQIPNVQFDKCLLWDTDAPYHYVRFWKDDAGNPMVLIGGEDHRTGQGVTPEHHYAELEAWCMRRLGFQPRVMARWSGQILEPIDGLAYIGTNPGDENVYIVTGDSGHGLTHGTIAGVLITDLIQGRENPWTALYDPSRLPIRSLTSFLRETLNTNIAYGDWISPGDVDDIEDIPVGEGAVVRHGLEKVAVFRDARGCTHSFSAVCPHLGGLVRWNSAEKTWDCPCHGSRFDKYGDVLNGPAVQALSPAREIAPGANTLSMPTETAP